MEKSKAKTLKWEESMKTYCKQETTLQGNLRNIFMVIWGQCSPAMQTKVKQHSDYKIKSRDTDCEWLLAQIKEVMYKFEGNTDLFSPSPKPDQTSNVF